MGRLDPVIHQENRLRIIAFLSSTGSSDRTDFNFLKETLGLSDGNLSVHLRKLEEAGLVLITKTFVGKKPRTWISITSVGRSAFRDYVEELGRIVLS